MTTCGENDNLGGLCIKRFLLVIVSAFLAINLCGCSFIGMMATDNKIFVNDINDSFAKLRDQNSDISKKMVSSVYDAIANQLTDLKSDQKTALKSKCTAFCACLYSNAKCNSVKVNRKDDTATVTANITINDISAMEKDMNEEMTSMSDKVSKMSVKELQSFLNCDITKASQSEITYYMYIKALDECIKSFKSKDYSKTQDSTFTYKYSNKEWNLTSDSEQALMKMVSP